MPGQTAALAAPAAVVILKVVVLQAARKKSNYQEGIETLHISSMHQLCCAESTPWLKKLDGASKHCYSTASGSRQPRTPVSYENSKMC